MPFVKSDPVAENKMLEELIEKSDEAWNAHREFVVRVELQKQLATARRSEGLTQADVAKKKQLCLM